MVSLGPANLEQTNNFHRLVQLSVSCGTEVLRKYLEKCLNESRKTFKQHLSAKCRKIPWRKLYPEQIEHLRSEKPDYTNFDVSLITLLILETCDPEDSVKEDIKALRKIRNMISHAVQAEVEGNEQFNRASQHLMKIAACIGAQFKAVIQKQINSIRMMKVVRRCDAMGRVFLYGERLMMALVDLDESAEVARDAELTWIKFNMTKWIKQLSRLRNIDIFMEKLLSNGIISSTVKMTIEIESLGEQMPLLVLHMLDETKENIYKFCKCLRELDENFADLLENNNTDGAETEKVLKDLESENVQRAIRKGLKQEANGRASCEQVHVYVEAEVQTRLTFGIIVKEFQKVFPNMRVRKNDTSFHGVTWAKKEGPAELGSSSVKTVQQMSCEEFAEYIGLEMEKAVRQPIKDSVQTAFVQSSIPPSVFLTMTEVEFNEVLSPYITFNFGIKKCMLRIQSDVKQTWIFTEDKNQPKCGAIALRAFDHPTPPDFFYKKACVKPDKGNLLVPVHKFHNKKDITSSFIAREAVRFISACINGRKNGTIHFGIDESSDRSGVVSGILKSRQICADNINRELVHCIQESFRLYSNSVLPCVRPVQEVTVDGTDNVVLEIDVVTSSWFCLDQLIPIHFPPKGPQEEKIFLLDQSPLCEILPVDMKNRDSVEELYSKIFVERRSLETERDNLVDEEKRLCKTLSELLKGKGNAYVTDEFIPIIVTGNMSRCENGESIKKVMNVDIAFSSAKVVLDFDSSTELRKDTENTKRIFNVKTAEDFVSSDNLGPDNQPVWLYCNGNDDLKMKHMELKEWISARLKGVTNALRLYREIIPKFRARVLFLLYGDFQPSDPIFETARDAVRTYFPEECIFICQNKGTISSLKSEICNLIEETTFEQYCFTGLPWTVIAKVLSSVFRPNPDVVCKLPASRGSVLMTQKEKDDLMLTDIDILSAEQCRNESEQMSAEQRRTHEKNLEKTFYKGGQSADWWNFFYPNHVGERSDFQVHKEVIAEKLKNSKGEALIERHVIEHHPGAGGSTLACHLMWHFSQFSEVKEPYRCCVVKNLTDKTVDQIERYRNFKNENTQRPFLLLLDNKSEDCLMALRSRLHEAAYKTGYPGKLFCLLIVVNRIPISCDTSSAKESRLLTHQLTEGEMMWFEKKYKELEQNESVNVDTLIAFNVMRKSFDEQYIEQLTTNLMEYVTPSEKKVLTCLSLINSFDNDHPIPQSVFDSLMNDQTETKQSLIPYGIVHSMKERAKMSRFRNGNGFFWNVNISNAVSLLVSKREDVDIYSSGISIISQPLARAVLKNIKRNSNLSLDDIVNCVLCLVGEQKTETNPASKQFVKIVCSLFKTRQVEDTGRGETKLKFSALILELEKSEGSDKVVTLMQRCFNITKDAMVGQQLARFNIHIKKFEAAEEAIKESLSQRSENSYLLDTYGQIFKTKMERLFEQENKGHKIENETAAEITLLAFKALEKFQNGQDIAIKVDEDTNMSCFHMEVKTALNLLEKFEKFECYEKHSFHQFLNNPDFEINESPYVHLMESCRQLENMRNGNSLQTHLESSLRYLEETNYQVKRHLYTVDTEDETLLLNLRERYERFYGDRSVTNRFEFQCGLGLKPIMMAMIVGDKTNLRYRVEKAEKNLACRSLDHIDVRDLLVYLGYKIIRLSNKDTSEKESECSQEDFKKLLRYSSRLLEVERKRQTTSRVYLESFLYWAMLHWPLPSRIALGLESLGRSCSYEHIMVEWEEAYKRNHNIKTVEQNRLKKPKNYFALGKGEPGNDIVDLESIRKEWMNRKKEEGRYRRPVFEDNFWKEKFVKERLERLEGTVSGDGHTILHEVQFTEYRKQKFRINTYYPCQSHSNRKVTFVLGFTWRGPTAFDVTDVDTERHSDSAHGSTNKCNPDSEQTVRHTDLTRGISCGGAAECSNSNSEASRAIGDASQEKKEKNRTEGTQQHAKKQKKKKKRR